VKTDAVPAARRLSPAATLIDAGHGFAYPAIDLAIEELCALARKSVVALAAIRRSHHFGQAGAHVERLAEAGLVAFLFGNSPKAMAFWGGKAPMIGTNPVAFAAPLPEGPPLVIDLALSIAAKRFPRTGPSTLKAGRRRIRPRRSKDRWRPSAARRARRWR
jgi:(2R)-3-sulfolactate dehydrogenase (NADP+)